MPAPAPRRLTISDAMLIVAAVAVGLIAIRPFLLELGPGATIDALVVRLRAMPRTDLIRTIPALGLMAAPTLASLSLALVALRLRRPRPRLHRLVRQPGFTACFASVVACLACASAILALRGTYFMDSIGGSDDIGLAQLFAAIVLSSSVVASGFVILTWLGLAISRNWRPEPGWIDRFGRVLGVFWLVMFGLGIWAVMTFR